MKFKVKEKPCAYSLCGLKFIPKRMGQKTCENAESGYECARGYAKEQQAMKAEKEKNELIAAYRENTKTLAEYKEELQELVNKIARLIDKGHACISSGRKTDNVHGGHLKTVGAHENIRFNLLNIYAQDGEQNTHQSGNVNGYRDGIEKTFGKELLEEIDGLSLKYKEIRIRKVDIVEAKMIAGKIIRELEHENKTYSTVERIELRRSINDRLGIYKELKTKAA
jgi:hypothetical protein